MFKIKENAIHCVNGKCIYPVQNRINNNSQYNFEDIYGKQDHSRLNELGIPLFVLQDEPIIEETIHIQNDIVISDDLYDKLFEKVEKQPQKRKTKKKRTSKGKK